MTLYEILDCFPLNSGHFFVCSLVLTGLAFVVLFCVSRFHCMQDREINAIHFLQLVPSILCPCSLPRLTLFSLECLRLFTEGKFLLFFDLKTKN